MSRYYHTCCANIGKAATIRTTYGKAYTGKIVRVTREHVYISSLGTAVGGQENKNLATTADGIHEKEQGQEVLFFAPFAIPLAAIAGLTFLGAAPFFARPFYGPRRFY
jgi:hypothetical protein